MFEEQERASTSASSKITDLHQFDRKWKLPRLQTAACLWRRPVPALVELSANGAFLPPSCFLLVMLPYIKLLIVIFRYVIQPPVLVCLGLLRVDDQAENTLFPLIKVLKRTRKGSLA